ncbi:enoyl-CoA hydratase/isomerase family protein [Microthyrium microscopicum]|uniref:Enoyl-CoA hydratase/isomerase family protein n=1 Tax=Microthyrium microscopicum TaxID=703497 RepID=A0A6A6USU6_9PEZI|nr:enoyl-CoA hydratase/isomerase family protein [Microthyrium microscopicum]
MSESDYSSIEHFKVSFPVEYVAHVEINRPQKMNAFIEIMWLNLKKIFDRLSDDPNVRAILFSGAGDRAFSAGLDVQAASQGGTLQTEASDVARKARKMRAHVIEFQDCISSLEACSKPVIALLHGVSYGLAIDMAAACDIRIACTNLRASVKEVDIGLAADIGSLTRLPKIVGSFSWVKEVALSAREFGAIEAEKVGLVSRVVDGGRAEGVKVGLEMCGLIAQKSPVAVWGTKEILNWSRERGVDDGLKFTAIWNAAMLQTDDVKAALLSGIQKRKAKFEKL